MAASLVFSCAPKPGYCPTAVHPSPATRDWLRTLTPPAYAKAYFDQLGDQQETIEKNCK